MRARQLASTLVVSLVGVVLNAGCENADPTAASPLEQTRAPLAAVVDLPFALSLVGHANPDFSQGPCNVRNVESGTGIALHLGAVEWSSEEAVSFCVDPADPGLGQVSGAVVITAANGDQLHGTYETVVHADFAANTLSATGSYVITGGTGRFANAGGAGTLSVTGSLLPPFDVAGRFTGTVSW